MLERMKKKQYLVVQVNLGFNFFFAVCCSVVTEINLYSVPLWKYFHPLRELTTVAVKKKIPSSEFDKEVSFKI